MKFFECEYRFCQLYRSCPKNHQVEATPHSDVDEAGMPLYFGRCEEISRTFSEVPYERVIQEELRVVSQQEKYRDKLSRLSDGVTTDEKSFIKDENKALIESLGSECSERIAEELWQKLQANPISVKVDGYTKQGEKQTYGIVTKTKPEKSWFSDKVLSGLFQTHPNTIANWRNGNAQAPEGFAEAFRNKDIQKMNECAAKYVLSRSKADAMNTKGVRREISEEQIYREGGNKCVKPQ